MDINIMSWSCNVMYFKQPRNILYFFVVSNVKNNSLVHVMHIIYNI